MPATLHLDALRVRLGGRTVIDGVTLEVERAERFCVLGPSGCGKTTLLRAIAGLERARGGRVLLGGSDATKLAPSRRGVAMVAQGPSLWPHMTALKCVAFSSGAPRRDREKEAAALLTEMGLGRALDRRVGRLSGGERKRVALARALAAKPQLLLLDEPLSDLDAPLRLRLRELIRSATRDRGVATLHVTHDFDEAAALARRAAVMRDGRVVQVGPPLTLYRDPASLFVARFTGEVNELPGAVRSVDGEGAVVDTPLGALRARTGGAGGKLAPKDEAVVCVRPEDIEFTPGENTDAAPATIVAVREERAGRRVTLQAGETRLVARFSGAAASPSGEVSLRFTPGRAVAFAKDG